MNLFSKPKPAVASVAAPAPVAPLPDESVLERSRRRRAGAVAGRRAVTSLLSGNADERLA